MDTVSIYQVSDITYNKDWEINVPGVQKKYRISETETARNHCNCGGNGYQVITAYHLNGVSKTGFWIDLKK